MLIACWYIDQVRNLLSKVEKDASLVILPIFFSHNDSDVISCISIQEDSSKTFCPKDWQNVNLSNKNICTFLLLSFLSSVDQVLDVDGQMQVSYFLLIVLTNFLYL